MASSEPQVDVVILTWNDGDRLAIAVASALGSTGVQPHVYVVDNGSEPPATVPPGVELIRNAANRGVAPARNQGARAGANGLVCFLDSDARLHPGCLAQLAEPLLADQSIVLSAPVFSDQAPAASAGKAPTLYRKVLRVAGATSDYDQAPDMSRPYWDVDFAIGACQLFRRDAFAAVDGLDESYFYGPEDVDFCLRLRERGGRVVQVRDAGCDHPPRRRFRKPLSRRGAQHAWAVLRHLWRHRGFSRRMR
ncbi:MAG TPA: glycosyltransferase [Acidimicrobiales bacterium]|nr:glycosyltransferase [Acidimicrobiales bacterium]